MRNVRSNFAEQTAPSPLAGIDDQYRAVFDAVNDGIFISDPTTGRFIEVNQAGCQMFGYEKGELIGCDIEMLSSGVHPYTQEEAIARGETALAGELPTFEWQCKTKYGDLFWAEISVRITQFGAVTAMVANVRDITERKKLTAEVEYMAHYDALTGLANRFMFKAALDRAIAQSLRSGLSVTVMFLDLDNFKKVNDTRGHAVGDRLLCLVADRLQASVHVDLGIFRLGGDEFALLLNGPCEPAQIAALASKLITTVSTPYLIDGMPVHVGASIGVAFHGPDARDQETLMSRADTALYRAKAEGRQTFRFHCSARDETG